MSIDPIASQHVQRAYVRDTGGEIAPAAAAPAGGGPNAAPVQHTAPVDKVSLSDTARSLASARHAVDSSSDVREDKVAALRAKIASGTYQVSPEAIASKMLSNGQVGADGKSK